MTDPDRVRLLYPPYKSPRLKRGDRAHCLFRGGTVVITGWSDARIPWPRCRAIDSTWGGSGLLVDEELARAVRREAAAAVMWWWRASGRAVFNWRKAMGVRRMENEGTARLMLASAHKGALGIIAHDWTDQERDQRSRRAVELGVDRNLILGYHGPRWTPEDIALLGTIPDEDVASRTGRKADAVRQKQEELGIANPVSGRWSGEEVALLGTLPDEAVAIQTGRSLAAVRQKRAKLGIPYRWDRRKIRQP
jgi:hypothetical protein